MTTELNTINSLLLQWNNITDLTPPSTIIDYIKILSNELPSLWQLFLFTHSTDLHIKEAKHICNELTQYIHRWLSNTARLISALCSCKYRSEIIYTIKKHLTTLQMAINELNENPPLLYPNRRPSDITL